MKKSTKLFMSTIILGALTVPVTTFAADGGVYTSNGVVEFVPNEDPTDPVDPTDPTGPVNPIDPTDPDGPNPGTNGPLSIDYASSLDFGVQKITSKDQTYFAASQKYNTLDAEGNPSTEVKEGPNYVQVTDNRGTEAGWSLKVNQEGQFTSTSGKELTGATISFKNGRVVTASDSGKPVGPETIVLNADGSQSDVMAASVGNGAGTYLYTWGTATTASESIELSVPGSTTKYAEKYSTKLTWTLTDVPGN
ncbi:cell surface protein [Enterococcus thailandicus]|uniref:WxL domain-containing protein n=1 Tax=bioreactor metagenome TaxID=1076179 RepID=A0A645CTF8_9ZZZZ|nr:MULTISPECIES: WxL domain-containing protein [Enterococcus]MDA3964467.1 WxL domain-containing protein [Enterococcus thailandicus]MDK4352518.1 WxL domain-containing protein [Enterococcus thailandicus]MDT2734684.1 WxL domain-containing protein [Enterococcus thailandicus]MEA4829853.1 WxL domain-containing protein [Enterococcus thailandicus]OTP23024.1 cell surface protein [Enterococcus sp. 5B7_DIV0075]